MTDILDRQIPGFADTMGLTAVLSGYLFLAAIPPFIWSRSHYYHPVWRGVETFLCYLMVALILGAIFAAVDDGGWSVSSGIAAGGDAWACIGSVVLLLAVFVAASCMGAKSAAGRKRHIKTRNRKKSMKKSNTTV